MDDTPRRMTNNESTADQDIDRETARKTQEIRSEIAQTRADMSETIDAIQDRLRPGNIAAAATDRIKDATSRAARRMADSASDTASSTARRTRRFVEDGGSGNNVARAMIGVGAAWLIIDRWRHSGEHRYNRRPPSYSRYRAEQWRGDEYTTSLSPEEDLTHDYGAASSRGPEMGTRVRQQGERALDGFDRLLRSNPLMVAAAAMAVGAAVGLALPETDRENEWMGEAREELFERAQDVARSTASQVRQAAGDIAGQVASEVVGGEESSKGGSQR
jgi:hypothetical protein